MSVVKRDNVAAFVKSIRTMAGTKVLVGIPEEKSPRKDDGPIGNAALGYIHENGSPEANIPARPFLVPGIKSVKKDLVPMFKKAGQVAMAGGPYMKNLTAIGLKASNAVKKKITDGPFAPLQPSTLAARKRRGRTGTKPLIDTGQLRNAVTFVIRRK